MAVDDSSDTQSLLVATPVYASKNLDVDDLEFDQECTYRKLPGSWEIFYIPTACENQSIENIDAFCSDIVTDWISANIQMRADFLAYICALSTHQRPDIPSNLRFMRNVAEFLILHHTASDYVEIWCNEISHLCRNNITLVVLNVSSNR